MKICVVIPVLNEAKTIGTIVEKIKQLKLDVVVIDDGSTDGSGRIARDNGAVVIDHPVRMGKGFSLREGFDYVRKAGYTGVITMDGDGQHAVEDLGCFVDLTNDNADIIVAGNRMDNPAGMPLLRLWTNKFMSWLISLVCRQKIPDSQCGFRYIGGAILGSLELTSNDYQIESEMLIQASRLGFKIRSIPVKTIYGEEVSKINPLMDTGRFMGFIIKQFWGPNSKPSLRK